MDSIFGYLINISSMIFFIKLLILSVWCFLFQTELAHREQVAMVLDLDNILDYDPDLCDAIVENSRRYVAIFNEAVQDLIPAYRRKEVSRQHYLRCSRCMIRILLGTVCGCHLHSVFYFITLLFPPFSLPPPYSHQPVFQYFAFDRFFIAFS